MKDWQGKIVQGPFWQEPVRVLEVRELDDVVWLKVEGTQSHQVWEHFFSSGELKQIQLAPQWDGQGDPERAFLALEGRRVRLAYLFDPLLAVTVSQIDPLPHQIEAVYRYILRNPRLRFLLADDPGAGKTIMAGLVLKELKYRGLVQKTLIVVPGHLREQWRREMKEKFGEDFVIVDRATVNAYAGRNVWDELPQVITSMDFAKQDDILQALKDTRWDLVIVDEAHKLAAYRYGRELHRTDRYRLGETLSPNTHFMLFLTATPHKGDPENFRLLLELLEPGIFPNAEVATQLLRGNEYPIFLRRLKEDLKNYDGSPLFPPREVTTICYRLSEAEKRLYKAVTEYVRRHFNRAQERKRRGVGFAMMILQRRLASSIRALRTTLVNRYERLRKVSARWEEFLRLQQMTVDEDELEDAPERERWEKENQAVEFLSSAESFVELYQELDELKRLIELVEEVANSGQETKLAELKKVTEDERIRKGEKLLIFTEAKETMEYLAEQLRKWGFSVTTLHGGMSMEERLRAENEFRHNAQVMVSTEAGGEGINLQFCWLMVNYDIPWNPNRLEQRIGRLHRYGQRHAVHIFNLVAEDTVEGRILMALQEKLQRIREALGSDRVFDVLGEIVDYLLNGQSLADLIVQAIANQLTLDDIISRIQRTPNEKLVSMVREISGEMLASRHVNMAWVLGESERAKENRIIPEYIERFFLRACQNLGVSVRSRGDGTFQIEWVPAMLRDVDSQFKRRFGEVQVSYRRFTFRKEKARDETVFVAPGHPFLESVVEKVMALGSEDLRRGACFYDPTGRWDGWLFVFEGEILDGRQTVAGKRLLAAYQPIDGSPVLVNPAVIWDLVPAKDLPADEPKPFPEEQLSIISVLLPEMRTYLEEIKAERERFARVRSEYAIPALKGLINEQSAKVADLEFRAQRGENVDIALRNARKKLDELRERLKELEKSIQTETTLSIGRIELITAFRVIPQPVEPSSESEMSENPSLEAIGLKVAMGYEKEQGRSPVDVSLQRLGYDIRSTAPDGTVRYIEVKTRARMGSVALTEHEWLKAKQLGRDYWLYIVENAVTQPTLWLIQDPTSKIQPKLKIVQYIVDDWKNVAEKA